MVLKMSISRVHDRDVMSDSVNVGARNMKKKNWFYGGFVESQYKTRSSSACHVRPLGLERLIIFEQF